MEVSLLPTEIEHRERDSLHIPFVDLRAQYRSLQRELLPQITAVLENAQFVLGPNVEAFEQEFADFTGIPHIIGCGNGSDALEMVFRAWNIQPGDEVIVPANAWITAMSAATMFGARPVFADTHARTCNLDAADVERKITGRTKAIVVVHLFGLPADIVRLVTHAQARGIKVLEDCAQAHGTTVRGRHVGTFGDAATFSFYPGKNLGAYGDAGAIGVANTGEAEWLHRLGNHGQGFKHDHRIEGRNSRMDELQAAILRVKLAHLGRWVAARKCHARRYLDQLQGLPLTLPVVPENAESSWHIFAIRCERRDALREALLRESIETNVHYPVALPFVPAYAHLGHRVSDFPNAHEQTSTLVALPMFPELTNHQIDRVCSAIRRFFGE